MSRSATAIATATTALNVPAAPLADAASWIAGTLSPRGFGPAATAVRLHHDPVAGTLRLSGWDWDSATRADVPTGLVGELPDVAVNARVFAEALGELDGEATLELRETSLILGDTSRRRRRYTLRTMPTDMMTNLPAVPPECGRVADLRAAVEAVAAFCGTDASGVPWLQSVRLATASHGRAFIDATDRYMAARWYLPWEGEPLAEDIVVSGSRLRGILRGIPAASSVLADHGFVGISDGQRVGLITRTAEHNFANVRDTWWDPPKGTTPVTLEREELLGALDAAVAVIGRRALVVLEGESDGPLTIRSATTQDETSGSEEVAVMDHPGPVRGKFQAALLRATVAALPHPIVRIWMPDGLGGRLGPAVARGLVGDPANGEELTTDDTRRTLVMPLQEV